MSLGVAQSPGCLGGLGTVTPGTATFTAHRQPEGQKKLELDPVAEPREEVTLCRHLATPSRATVRPQCSARHQPEPGNPISSVASAGFNQPGLPALWPLPPKHANGTARKGSAGLILLVHPGPEIKREAGYWAAPGLPTAMPSGTDPSPLPPMGTALTLRTSRGHGGLGCLLDPLGPVALEGPALHPAYTRQGPSLLLRLTIGWDPRL